MEPLVVSLPFLNLMPMRAEKRDPLGQQLLIGGVDILNFSGHSTRGPPTVESVVTSERIRSAVAETASSMY